MSVSPFSEWTFTFMFFFKASVVAADTLHPSDPGESYHDRWRSCSTFIVSIWDEALRSCLTCCSNLDMNAHVTHQQNQPMQISQKFVNSFSRTKMSCHKLVECVELVCCICSYEGLFNLFCICPLLFTKPPVHGKSTASLSQWENVLNLVHGAEFTDQLHILGPFNNGHIGYCAAEFWD